MSEHTHVEVRHALAEHERKIDELHHKLSSIEHVDKAKLAAAVEKYKKAHKVFHDDCLECWKP